MLVQAARPNVQNWGQVRVFEPNFSGNRRNLIKTRTCPLFLWNQTRRPPRTPAETAEIGASQWVSPISCPRFPSQKPFPYQRKCLGWLRESYAKLSPADRKIVDATLAGTG